MAKQKSGAGSVSVKRKSGRKGKTKLRNSGEKSRTSETKENENMLYRDSLKGIKVLSFPTEQLRSHLRTTISRQLVQGFAIPEIIEGLVEYFLDIVREDPGQARLLGVLD